MVSEEGQKWNHNSKLTLASPGLQSSTVLRDCKEWIMHCSNWDGWKSNKSLAVDMHVKYTLHKYIKTYKLYSKLSISKLSQIRGGEKKKFTLHILPEDPFIVMHFCT